MSITGTATLEQYESALDVLRALPTAVTDLRGWDDATLLAASELHTRAGRAHGAAGAAIAGELAYRSRPALGNQGLARRSGYRTVENLLQATTGATKEHVLTVVAAGTLVAEIADDGKLDEITGEVLAPTQPWLRPVAAGVAEAEAFALRSLTHHPLAGGGGVATWRMDPETYALFVDGFDRMTSPKRGGGGLLTRPPPTSPTGSRWTPAATSRWPRTGSCT